jgi:hypothetical protein
MIEIGERPILWHIMKGYSHHGFNEFVICLGYKGYSIKEYFAHYFLHESDVTFDFRGPGSRKVHSHTAEPRKVTLVDTGLETATGGRVKRTRPYIGNQTFMLTSGDGVSEIDIRRLAAFHKSHGKLATITATHSGGRFGALDLAEDNRVRGFKEKPKRNGGRVFDDRLSSPPARTRPRVRRRLAAHIQRGPGYAREEARSRKTLAVMLAHTMGNPFDVNRVKRFFSRHDLWPIEDNCDALGSKYEGRFTGTTGHIATQSFYPPHHMTMGEGWALFTNDPTLKRLIESFRD